MMNDKAPNRGHSSIYYSAWIIDNWSLVAQYVTAKGYSSYNQYINTLIIDDVRRNSSEVLGSSPFRKDEIRWDFYQPIPASIKTIAYKYSDGQLYDVFVLLNNWRNLLIMELKRRGVKL